MRCHGTEGAIGYETYAPSSPRSQRWLQMSPQAYAPSRWRRSQVYCVKFCFGENVLLQHFGQTSVSIAAMAAGERRGTRESGRPVLFTLKTLHESTLTSVDALCDAVDPRFTNIYGTLRLSLSDYLKRSFSDCSDRIEMMEPYRSVSESSTAQFAVQSHSCNRSPCRCASQSPPQCWRHG
jgi:hypothetical protein